MRDAFEEALAKAAAKRTSVSDDGDETRLLLRIKVSTGSPTIKYKSRAAVAPVRRESRAPCKTPDKRQRRPAKKAISIDGAALDRRMRLALLKAQRTKHMPLAPTLAVYRSTPAGVNPERSGRTGTTSTASTIAQLTADARVACPIVAARATLLDDGVEARGVALQHIVATETAPRELVLGLDFGSSSTKLLVCDRAAGKSFCVAVADAPGTSRYLLPTAIRHCNGHYSLRGDGTLYTGLKSDLLALADDVRVRERAVAFLALAIRRARGWLFKIHEAIYRDVPIVWTLTIGIPKRQGQTDRDTDLYACLATAAWQVAGSPGPVTSETVLYALQRNRGRPASDETVEVRVVPEIAAEIYGFVSSESFDPKGDNIFLMVDIGGKTLDASLFHARQKKVGQWDFSFFTSIVRPLGAIELHSARIEWWQELIRGRSNDEQAMRLIADLEALKQTRMFEETIPAKATDYVEGVELARGSEAGTPDDTYRTEVRVTVRRKAYENAFRVQLSDRQMDRVEYFLCGGGSRMAIYSKVIHAALGGPNGSLFHARRRTLRVPADLEAPGLPEPEYDRFAVAYGLSRLDRTKVIDVKPVAPRRRPGGRYGDRFISKDMC